MSGPNGDDVFGVDVSRWQGTIDWTALAPVISYAFIKATGGDGGLYVDGQYHRNVAAAHAVGVPTGAYHFASNMAFNPRVEAAHFCSTIRGSGHRLPPVLDWETTLPSSKASASTDWVLAFCDEVEDQLGVRPIIYTGAYVTLERRPALLDYDLWLAAYTAKPIPCAPWGANWSIWQYTSSARLPGVTANTVDGNWARRSWFNKVMGQRDLHVEPVEEPKDEDEDMKQIAWTHEVDKVWLENNGLPTVPSAFLVWGGFVRYLTPADLAAYKADGVEDIGTKSEAWFDAHTLVPRKLEGPLL